MASTLHRLSTSSTTGAHATGTCAGGAVTEEQAGSETIKVFLIDDHQIVRRGIGELLSTVDDIEVVGEASNGEEARGHLTQARPHVAIIDMHLGRGNRSGIEVCGEIHSTLPEIACLMLTSIADVVACTAAVTSGASGYLLKQIRGSELIDSIRLVAAGSTVIPSNLVTEVLDQLRGQGGDLLGALTTPERRMLDLIAAGHTSKEVGDEFDLAETEVQSSVLGLLTALTKNSGAIGWAVGRHVRPLPWNS